MNAAFETSRAACTSCRFGTYWHHCSYHEGYADALSVVEDQLEKVRDVLLFYSDGETYKDRKVGHNQYGTWVRFTPPLIYEDNYGDQARTALKIVRDLL